MVYKTKFSLKISYSTHVFLAQLVTKTSNEHSKQFLSDFHTDGPPGTTVSSSALDLAYTAPAPG